MLQGENPLSSINGFLLFILKGNLRLNLGFYYDMMLKIKN